MKRFLAATLALSAILTAHGAAAADLSLAPLYKSPPAPQPQPYDWSGFYFGANGGGGWGHSWWNSNATGMNLAGAQAGGTAGYNFQFGRTVLGVEGDIDWSGLSGSSTSPGCPAGCSTSDSWLSTVRGRVGYAFDRSCLMSPAASRLATFVPQRPAFLAATRPTPAGRLAQASKLRCRVTGAPRQNIFA